MLPHGARHAFDTTHLGPLRPGGVQPNAVGGVIESWSCWGASTGSGWSVQPSSSGIRRYAPRCVTVSQRVVSARCVSAARDEKTPGRPETGCDLGFRWWVVRDSNPRPAD